MDVSPVHYDLAFEPDLKRFTFEGSERVEIDCARPVRTIVMDCAELDVRSCRVTAGGSEVACTHRTDGRKEELRIRLARAVRGRAEVSLEFSGTLNDRLLGFYRSRYRHRGRTRYMATTQFEAADARRAFPCWDEPAAKATFAITITADAGLGAISNMPARSKRRVRGRTVHTFERTPPMPTYLVYLGVGEFEYLSGRAGRTRIRVVTTPGNRPKGRFALDMARRLLPAYESYFGTRYPLPKLDLIAVPDFAAGAMENWGAITFREAILLYDPRTSSTRTKQFIAEVISHEIAHQWFGNLVTMEWWNDLWLNESFATLMATKFVDMLHPEWDMQSQFVEDAMNAAMDLDALRGTHPVDVPVRSPSEIREIFDAISYDKGGCVLRMLEDHVGEAAFRRGLRRYLAEFKYANARGEDLWRAVGRASKKPVSSMVKKWLTQPGFPLVEASRDGAVLRLAQGRYLLGGGRARGTWPIPLLAGHGRGAVRRSFSAPTARIRVPAGPGGPVINPGRKGFYRVRYDQSMMLDLKMMVDQKGMPAIDRWAVQNDLFSLCISCKEPVRNYLDFADAYLDEDDYMVLRNVAHNLNSLYLRTRGLRIGEVRGHAAAHMHAILGRLGWEPRASDSHTDALLRPLAVSALGVMGDGGVASGARGRYLRFLRSPRSLHPDMVEAVCSVASWNGGPSTHSQLRRLYRGAGSSEEEARFLGAMCAAGDARLLAKSLDFALSGAVRSQNMQLPIMRAAANPVGRRVLWPWLRRNWDALDAKVGHGNPLFNRIVASISSAADDSMAGEIRRFFARNPVPGTERTQAQMLERIRINSRFVRAAKREFGIA